MFVKMDYEMFAERLPEFTDAQKKYIWGRIEEAERNYTTDSSQLVFDAETIKSDWIVYDGATGLVKEMIKKYPVEEWAKDHESELIRGETPSYRESLKEAMETCSLRWAVLLSDGTYIKLRD